MQSLFEIEKARRDVIFRDKNVANFNIIGQKSYAKSYPIKRIKKVFYNDIVSYEEFLGGNVQAAINDPELNIKPMSRKLNDVFENKTNIVRVKAKKIDNALKTYAAETNDEYIEKNPFN